MKLLRVVLVFLLVIVVLVSCSKVMLAVGKAASQAMQGKTGNVEELTAQIKIAHYHREYPFTELVIEYLADKGVAKSSIGSYTSLFLTKGMKFMEVDGIVQCNQQNMQFVGSGTYLLETNIAPNQEYTFYLKGNEQGDETFSETYTGETLEILAPQPGELVDLSQGFDIRWKPGTDPQKFVKVTMFIAQMGLQNAMPLWSFPDNGKATVTPEMLAEISGQAMQNFVMGENYLIMERQKDEIRYILNGDAMVMQIDGDAVPIQVTGKAPKLVKPALASFTAAHEDVVLNVQEAQLLHSMQGGMDCFRMIHNVGLSSFALQGRTSGTDVKTQKVGIYKITTTRSWGADFGEAFLQQAANTMADRFMEKMTSSLSAQEIPTANIIATQGYQRMNQVEIDSDMNSFYVTARQTTAFDGLKQFKVKIGGLNSWYYDMMKSSGCDALVEVYLTLSRHAPEPGKADEFVFDVSATVQYRSNPTWLTERNKCIPVVTGQWTSEKFSGTQLSVDDFLQHLRYHDFLGAYTKSLHMLQEKQEELRL